MTSWPLMALLLFMAPKGATLPTLGNPDLELASVMRNED